MSRKMTEYDRAAAQKIESLEAFYRGRSADRKHLRGAVVSLLTAFEGVREIGTSNKGYWVDRFHKDVGLAPGQPWCVMLPQYAFRVAAGWLGLPDPLPYNTASTQSLAAHAEQNGLCRGNIAEISFADLLIWRNGRSWQGHVGTAIEPSEETETGLFLVKTFEGNTSAKDYRDGGIAARKQYHYREADLGKARSRGRYLRCVVSFDALMDKYVFTEVQ